MSSTIAFISQIFLLNSKKTLKLNQISIMSINIILEVSQPLQLVVNIAIAVATFTSAGVALYLGLSERKPTAKVSIESVGMIYNSSPKVFQTDDDIVYVATLRISNTGSKTIHISGLGWKYSKRNCTTAYIMPPQNAMSSNLPHAIREGEYIQLMFEYDHFLKEAVKYFSTFNNELLFKHKLYNSYIFFNSMTGFTFKKKISRDLANSILASIKSNKRIETPKDYNKNNPFASL